MRVTPDADSFAAAYDGGTPQILMTSIVADLETPVSAMIKLAGGLTNAFLLESVEGGANRGRYSFIGLQPDLVWRCRGNAAEISTGVFDDECARDFAPCPEGALDSLRGIVAASTIPLPDGIPPMAAGLVGYMAYDMVRLMEDIPDDNPDPLGLPDSIFLRPTVTAIFDNLKDSLTVTTPVRPEEGISAAEAYAGGSARLAGALEALGRAIPRDTPGPETAIAPPEPTSNMAPQRFHDMVERSKEYILAGDAFQVVVSQRFEMPFTLPPFTLYRALRRLNPSPFLFFLDYGEFSIVGSSPEILVRLRDGVITIRPVAGTRPRGRDAEEDAAFAADLLSDPKELAEHLMLLDLGRNDVGRAARVGTVSVVEKMVIEYYSHVMHIASHVEGGIADRHDALSALAAGFPAGTVSGAPKVRAMEIIDELEPERRGIYAGCIGYFGADGDMDTCIALRTAVVKDGRIHVQAGGGIVADSDPSAEWQESWNKAMAVMRAAEEAVSYAMEGG